MQAQIIEYQLHTLRCRHCDRLTEAGWPEGVSRHTFGPSVQAWVGLLAGAYRLSKRNIRALLSDAFGLEVSLSTVSRLEQEVAAALAGPVEEARAFVRRQGIVNVDETGWRQRRAKAWLWTAVTEGVSVFAMPQAGDGTESMRCWVRTTGRWSAPIAIRPTGIYRFDAGKSAGLICGAPSRSSWPGAARPPGSDNACWTPATSCLPGGTGSAPAPCNGPASRSTSAACVGGFIITGVWSAVRRRQDGGHLR